jgi:hypothetical protein
MSKEIYVSSKIRQKPLLQVVHKKAINKKYPFILLSATLEKT